MLNQLLSWNGKDCDHGWGGKYEGRLTHRQQEDNWNLGYVFVSDLVSTGLVFDKYPSGPCMKERREPKIKVNWAETSSSEMTWELCDWLWALSPSLPPPMLCAFTRKGEIFRTDSGRKVSWKNRLFSQTCYYELIAPADKTTSILMSCWLNWHIAPGHIIWTQQYVGKRNVLLIMRIH